MKMQILKSNLSAVIGLLLTTPMLYFIFSSVLKYVFGVPILFDAAQPILEAWGIKGTIGWNINIAVFFGPLAILMFTAASVLQLDWQNYKDQMNFCLSSQNSFRRWLLIAISCLTLITLFLCHCRKFQLPIKFSRLLPAPNLFMELLSICLLKSYK